MQKNNENGRLASINITEIRVKATAQSAGSSAMFTTSMVSGIVVSNFN